MSRVGRTFDAVVAGPTTLNRVGAGFLTRIYNGFQEAPIIASWELNLNQTVKILAIFIQVNSMLGSNWSCVLCRKILALDAIICLNVRTNECI